MAALLRVMGDLSASRAQAEAARALAGRAARPAAYRRSVFPEVSKPIRGKLAASDGMLDVLVAEIVLQRSAGPINRESLQTDFQ
jgi:hypothetical protein